MRIYALAALAALATGPALAAGNPVSLVQTITMDNAPVADDLAAGKSTAGKKCGEDDEKPCLTIQRAVEHALLLCTGAPLCPNEKPDGDAKYRRAKIADKVEAGQALAPDEVVIVEGLVGQMYSPVVIRAVWDALGPPSSVSK
jgi:hypothetical protein